MTEHGSSQSDLEAALREIESHVAATGWDQPTRLFALVPTDELLSQEPSLIGDLLDDGPTPSLTSVEQSDLPDHEDLSDLLARLSWPDAVLGIAVVAERIVLPEGADDDLPSDRTQARAAAMRDPRRHEIRIAAASLRDGSRYCLLRLREHDADDSLLAGPELITGLAEMLHQSLTAPSGDGA
jgi:hypothetical protein